MNEDYLVTCGEWSTTETVDIEIFENHKEACFEAATKSLEKYFKVTAPPEKSLTTCIVRPARSLDNNKNDYLIFPPRLYENIGFHVVAKYFKKNKQL